MFGLVSDRELVTEDRAEAQGAVEKHEDEAWTQTQERISVQEVARVPPAGRLRSWAQARSEV